MVEYKKCPKCGGWIPKHWTYHRECGWNVQEPEQAEKDEIVREMERSISDTFEIRKRLRQRYPVECSRLNLTKIALTLFIEKRKNVLKFLHELTDKGKPK